METRPNKYSTIYQRRIWKSNRIRTKGAQTSQNKKCNFSTIKDKIEKTIKTKIGVDTRFILKTLKCVPSFLGCFSENEVNGIIFQSFPCFLIVNVDQNDMPGSHWLAIGVFKNVIEIFDPLGFNIFNWARIPCSLLNFLHRLTVSRSVKLCPRIQDNRSVLCGFYSMFYVISRSSLSFTEIINCFDEQTSNNDRRLVKLFS